MKALIVVESCFGNTEQVARAIEAGLRLRGADVSLVQAAEAGNVTEVDLLLIGSPTHSMGLPKQATRAQASRQGGNPQNMGVAEWLGTFEPEQGQRVALFATVVGGIFSGSASKTIEKRLRRSPAVVIAREDFRVLGMPGPLADGELERAQRWGESLL
ncbi:flavodoxin domain-containing protein [Tessaracoccus sp. OH4464_COT-324]|uniref:flavodoxin family protein n=1 Tax=Tessaracoccus sp. OH4464_COT-324 TaxID=2491059 RepID=UPI000F635FBE|nr:flavodoxin domain-containing protein [Tessaracoccus sp. OH4464_COT-324]RRD47246.1 flavodoxin/nitric oxide synthase [Tessaracoccus sp. OH4464_COT-324]